MKMPIIVLSLILLTACSAAPEKRTYRTVPTAPEISQTADSKNAKAVENASSQTTDLLKSLPGISVETIEFQDLFTGTWSGTLHRQATKKIPNDPGNEFYEVIITICENDTKVLLNVGENDFRVLDRDFFMERKLGNLIFYNIHTTPSWQETQSWSLVMIDPSRADIQWSRMVSNLRLHADHELRSFGELGYGTITKASNKCAPMNPSKRWAAKRTKARFDFVSSITRPSDAANKWQALPSLNLQKEWKKNPISPRISGIRQQPNRLQH